MRIAVLDDYQGIAETLADWGTLGAEVTYFDQHIPDLAQLIDMLEEFEVIVAMRERTPFPRALLEELPQLQLLVTTGRRNASIDVRAASQLGVIVSGTESLAHPTAELTLALMLALSRGLVLEVDSVRSGGWQAGLGVDLQGRTLGLIGLGRLGTRVAQLARGFGMDVVAWSENLTEERAHEAGVRPVTKTEALRTSDFISIHLRLSNRTEGLIGAEELSLMKSSAFLINTSRGPIVDEDALLQAVRARTIAGAGIDVYSQEPLPDHHPFRTEARILATPHIGYVTEESYRVFYEGAVESIKAWQDGNPIRLLS